MTAAVKNSDNDSRGFPIVLYHESTVSLEPYQIANLHAIDTQRPS